MSEGFTSGFYSRAIVMVFIATSVLMYAGDTKNSYAVEPGQNVQQLKEFSLSASVAQRGDSGQPSRPDGKKPVGPDGPKEPLGAESRGNHSPAQAAPGVSSMNSRNQGILGVRLMAFCTFFVLFLVFLRERKSLHFGNILGYLTLFAAAFALRWLWPDHTVFHENHHGYDYIRSIQSGFGQTYGFTSSYIVLMNLLVTGFHPVDDGVFFWNAVISALQSPLLACLFYQLSKEKWIGFMAGAMWACTPHAIRLGPTETYFNFITLLLIAAPMVLSTAMLRIREWQQPLNAWLWTIGALGLVILEAKSRVLTLIHPLAILLFALGLGIGKSAREKMALIFGSVAVTAALIGQLFNILDVAEHSPQGRSLVDVNHFIEYGKDFVFFDPDVVSPLVLPLALLGVVFYLVNGIRERTFLPLFTLAGILYLALVAGSVHGTFPSRVRFELPVHAFIVGLAASGVWGLTQITHHPKPAVRKLMTTMGTALGGVALCLVALSTHSWVSKPMHEQIEYPFLRQVVLPTIEAHEESTILVPDAPAPTGTIPAHWWRHHVPDKEWTTSDTSNAAGLMYLGLECFWTAPGWNKGYPYHRAYPENIRTTEGVLAVHPECAEAAGNTLWKPVHTKRAGRAIPDPCVDLKPGIREVEFGLFERVSSP